MQFINGKSYRLKSGVASNSKCVKASDLEIVNEITRYTWEVRLQFDSPIYLCVPNDFLAFDTYEPHLYTQVPLNDLNQEGNNIIMMSNRGSDEYFHADYTSADGGSDHLYMIYEDIQLALNTEFCDCRGAELYLMTYEDIVYTATSNVAQSFDLYLEMYPYYNGEIPFNLFNYSNSDWQPLVMKLDIGITVGPNIDDGIYIVNGRCDHNTIAINNDDTQTRTYTTTIYNMHFIGVPN